MCGLLDKRGLGERETAWLVITESPRATSLAIMMQLKLAVISLILADMADGICLEPLGIFSIPFPLSFSFLSFFFFQWPSYRNRNTDVSAPRLMFVGVRDA